MFATIMCSEILFIWLRNIGVGSLKPSWNLSKSIFIFILKWFRRNILINFKSWRCVWCFDNDILLAYWPNLERKKFNWIYTKRTADSKRFLNWFLIYHSYSLYNTFICNQEATRINKKLQKWKYFNEKKSID